MLRESILVKLNHSTAPWILASTVAVAIFLAVAVRIGVFRPPTSDELMARLDQAIAEAMAKAEEGDVDGARQAIPSWSKLNVDYMRPLARKIVEISSGPGDKHSKACSAGGLEISMHLGDVKRAVAG